LIRAGRARATVLASLYHCFSNKFYRQSLKKQRLFFMKVAPALFAFSVKGHTLKASFRVRFLFQKVRLYAFPLLFINHAADPSSVFL